MIDTSNYILKHRKPVPCADLFKWAKAFEVRRSRRIRVTYLDKVKISTVFLCLDHGWDGIPMLFETMIFGLPDTDDDFEFQTRCTTHRQALKMHKNAVLFAKGYLLGWKNQPKLVCSDGVLV